MAARQSSSWLTTERLAVASLLAFTLLVRGAVLWGMRDKLADDPDAYREIAENLLRHGVFALGKESANAPRDLNDKPQPTAYRPPLYPIVLSNLGAGDGEHVSLGKVAGLHLLLGLGTVWLTWLLARRYVGWAVPTKLASESTAMPWWAQPTLRGPLAAGFLVACDPILLNQSALVMTETLAAFLAVLALWYLARFDSQRSWFNAGLAGGAMGLAVLCRPTFLPWLGLAGIGMLFVRGRIANCEMQIAKCKLGWADTGWRVANCLALVVVAGMVVSPWVVRNQRVFGKPIVTTTHGGYTLWLGNNIDFYDWLRNDASGLPWDVTRQRDQKRIIDEAFLRINIVLQMHESKFYEKWPHKELGEDYLFNQVATRTILDDPVGFVQACMYRVVQLWSPLPNKLTADESMGRRLLRYAVAVWYCGVYLLAAVGIWRIWRGRRKSGPPLRGRPEAGKDSAASETAAGGEPTLGPVLPRSGGPRLGRPRWVWGVLLCLIFTGVHTFYWSNLRMRAPLMPFVACVAAAAIWPAKRN